jgi:hypothetical protein
MARGWESKSVEEQQNEFGKTSAERRGPLSPDEEKRLLHRQSLELNRARVLEQLKRSQNPRYTELLNRELEQLDRELASNQ